MEHSDQSAPLKLTRVDVAPGTAPLLHPDIAGFWDSLRDGQLSVQRCGECSTLRFPISTNCHVCLSGEYAWEAIDPRGLVNVAIEAHAAVSDVPASGISLTNPWRGMTPYKSGIVDMLAGVRLPGRIVCSCGQGLVPGARVVAVQMGAADGATVYGFEHECE